jgi:hypothetical protein
LSASGFPNHPRPPTTVDDQHTEWVREARKGTDPKMDTLFERCAGLDIGKADLKACIRVPGPADAAIARSAPSPP